MVKFLYQLLGMAYIATFVLVVLFLDITLRKRKFHSSMLKLGNGLFHWHRMESSWSNSSLMSLRYASVSFSSRFASLSYIEKKKEKEVYIFALVPLVGIVSF